MFGWILKALGVAGGVMVLAVVGSAVFYFTTDWHESREEVEIDGVLTPCLVKRKWPIVEYVPVGLPSGQYIRHPPTHVPPSPQRPSPADNEDED